MHERCIPALDIVPINPPGVVVKTDGMVVKTIASQITDDHELKPFGFVVTAPEGAISKVAEDTGEKLTLPPSGGNLVMGIVGAGYILFHMVIANKQPWYKQSAGKQIKRAERQAANMVLCHLGIE